MSNILPIASLDTFDVLPKLHSSHPRHWKPVAERGEVMSEKIGLGASLLLRGHEGSTKENWLDNLPVIDRPALTEWPSMLRLLEQCRAAVMGQTISQNLLSGEMARAMISRLDPGSTIFWHVDNGPYHEKTARFHLALVTNPGCTMYSGLETMHMVQGVLYYFNNHVRHSAANFGEFMRLHLIFEMYKK